MSRSSFPIGPFFTSSIHSLASFCLHFTPSCRPVAAGHDGPAWRPVHNPVLAGAWCGDEGGLAGPWGRAGGRSGVCGAAAASPAPPATDSASAPASAPSPSHSSHAPTLHRLGSVPGPVMGSIWKRRNVESPVPGKKSGLSPSFIPADAFVIRLTFKLPRPVDSSTLVPYGLSIDTWEHRFVIEGGIEGASGPSGVRGVPAA